MFTNEVYYKTSRSGGAGGQHVNKVSTKVELLFNVNESNILSDQQKKLINDRLKNRIDQNGVLHLTCSTTRSQSKNKLLVYEQFIKLIKAALKKQKKRKPTKPSKKAVEKRLEEKKKLAKKKQDRNFKG